MAKHPRPIENLLQSAGPLRQLGRRLAAQQALLQRVRQLLPEHLAPHCQAAILSEQRLTLYAASPAWASRLRYQGPDLQRRLQPEHPDLNQVRIRVAGAEVAGPPKPPAVPATPLSANNQRLLQATAEGQTDPALRAALLRLSRHGGA